MLGQEFAFEEIRIIKVHAAALGIGQMGKIEIIRIRAEEGDFTGKYF